MHFGRGKSRDVLCRACRTARRDTLVTTGATRTTRVQGHRRSVDWGGHVHLTFSRIVREIEANPEHKRLNVYRRALLFLRCPPCWNKHGSTRSSRRARHVVLCRDVTWRAKWNIGDSSENVMSNWCGNSGHWWVKCPPTPLPQSPCYAAGCVVCSRCLFVDRFASISLKFDQSFGHADS